MAKKKKTPTSSAGTVTPSSTLSLSSAASVMETILQVSEGSIENSSSSKTTTDILSGTTASSDAEKAKSCPVFKNPAWVSKNSLTGKRSKVWKSLKQILTSEKQMHSHNVTLYSTIDAPPSTRCIKKYSDISGLPAKYTDPLTKLRYSNSKEFRKLRSLAPEIVQGYLSLRKAEVIGQL